MCRREGALMVGGLGHRPGSLEGIVVSGGAAHLTQCNCSDYVSLYVL